MALDNLDRSNLTHDSLRQAALEEVRDQCRQYLADLRKWEQDVEHHGVTSTNSAIDWRERLDRHWQVAWAIMELGLVLLR